MTSASLIKKRSIKDRLAQQSISLSNSDRQRCCFLMRWAGEKAPQGIDKRFASFGATKEDAPRRNLCRFICRVGNNYRCVTYQVCYKKLRVAGTVQKKLEIAFPKFRDSNQGLAMTAGVGAVPSCTGLAKHKNGLSLSPLREFNKSSVKNKKLFEAKQVLFV